MVDVGDESVQADVEQTAPPRAVLFELETAAVPGRQVFFDVMKSTLAAKDVEMSLPLFARFYLEAAGSSFPANILAEQGKGRVSDAKLIEEINANTAAALLKKDLAPDPTFVDALTKARKKGVLVGAVGLFDEKTGTGCLGKFGLGELCDQVMSCRGGVCHTFTDETWINMARALDVKPTACVAVSSSARSSRAAVVAGMGSVAVADAFTEYQDFGGADFVSFGGFDADAATAILELLDRE
jgi:beta-phosphoglucomutase-like phosphatase (HAD superfamily)